MNKTQSEALSPVPFLRGSSPGRLLVVDDDVAFLSPLCEFLSAAGYEVTGRVSGREALEAMDERRFDLLLADLVMPEMDGIALVRAAQERDPQLVSLVMTGQGSIQSAVDAMKAGAFDYLVKPLEFKMLDQVLARALDIRRLRMENRELRDAVEVYRLRQALQENEERFRQIFESGPLGMLIASPDYRILRVNKALCGMLGYLEDELIGRAIEDITYPADRGKSREMSLQVLEGTIPRFHLEKRYMKKDGEPVWVNLTATTVHGPRGEVLYALGMVEDISERKKAEEETMRLYQQISEEAEISSSLVKIVNVLNRSLSETELIRNVITLTPNYLRFDRITIFLYDENLRGFTFAGGCGLTPVEEGILVSRTFREGAFPAMDKFLKGEAVLIENAAGSNLLTRELVDTFHIGSILMIPITIRGKVMGGMTGGYKNARAIGRRDASLLQGLADGMAIALQNSRLYRESLEGLMELSAKIETINAMSQLDKEILSSIDKGSILRTATSLINRIIPCDRLAVLLKEGDLFRVISEWGIGHFEDRSYPLKGSHFETFEKSRASLYLPDTSRDNCPYHKEQGAAGIVSSLLVPLITKEGTVGLLDIGSIHSGRLTPNHLSTAENIASQIAVALENARLYEELQQLLISTITSLASAIDAKSPWTKGHSERVTRYAVEIGREMKLKDEELERLKLAGLLHDVGKIGTDDVLLDKIEQFTLDESNIVKKHPEKGAEILAPIRQLSDVIPGIVHHHERYDGKGYPDGLKGDAIPLYGRILCAADSYDAMTADRPYRTAPGKEYAVSELKSCSGTQFDPKVIEAFLKVLAR